MSLRGTRLLLAGPSLQLECGTRGHSMWGQPRAEMDTKKVNTNTSTVDPLMALKTMVLQASWGAGKHLHCSQLSRGHCPKDCPLPAPHLMLAAAALASIARTSSLTRVAAPRSHHQHIRWHVGSTSAPQLQPCSSAGAKQLTS